MNLRAGLWPFYENHYVIGMATLILDVSIQCHIVVRNALISEHALWPHPTTRLGHRADFHHCKSSTLA